MKKKIVMLLIITSIFSCTDNSKIGKHGDSPKEDLIIGEWILHSLIKKGIDITSECDKLTALEFNPYHSVSGTAHATDLGNNCTNDKIDSTWKKNDNGTYSINGAIVEIFFSENNTVCKMIVTGKDPDYEDIPIVLDDIFKVLDDEYTFKKK